MHKGNAPWKCAVEMRREMHKITPALKGRAIRRKALRACGNIADLEPYFSILFRPGGPFSE